MLKRWILATCAVVGVLGGCGRPRDPVSEDKFRVAAWRGDLEEVERWLADGMAVDVPGENGRTALYLAASEGRHAVVRLLLERGADVNAADSAGFTALFGAAQADDVEMVRLLLDAGANVNAPIKDPSSPLMGQTPLDWTSETGKRGAAAQLLRSRGGKTREELQAK